jgi:hypothetical protein
LLAEQKQLERIEFAIDKAARLERYERARLRIEERKLRGD